MQVPSICFPATTDATELIVLFVSEVGAYNPLAYCGSVAVVQADVKGSVTDPAKKKNTESGQKHKIMHKITLKIKSFH